MTVKPLNLSLPVVHLNGSGRQALLDGYLNAISAISTATKALQDTCPNMRDYYVRKDADAAFRSARDEHYARIARLDEIKRELNALALHVTDTRDRR